MNTEQNQLAVRNPLALETWEDMTKMAEQIAESGMLGVKNPAQAMVLFALCAAENISPISAIRRYHIIHNRPSMRADAMLAEFIAHGGRVIWHIRTDELVCATLLEGFDKLDETEELAMVEGATERGHARFLLLWDLEFEEKPEERMRIIKELAPLARNGEQTILRSMNDSVNKGIALEDGGETKVVWSRYPREMLTARVITEGVRLINPGLVTGIVETNEAGDIADTERRTRMIKLKDNTQDKAAMQEILEQHRRDAEEATDPEERRRLLGLAAEMRVRISDLDVGKEPAKTVETEVLPPEEDNLPGLKKEDWWKIYEPQAIKSLKGEVLGDLSKETIQTLMEKKGRVTDKSSPQAQNDAAAIQAAYAFHFPAEQ